MSDLQKTGLVPRLCRWLGGVHAGGIGSTGQVRRLDAQLPRRTVLVQANSAGALPTVNDQRDEDDPGMASDDVASSFGGIRSGTWFVGRGFKIGRCGLGRVALGLGVSHVRRL